MDVIDDLSCATLRQETILTIGAFDGVHRGHRALIGQVVARARATDRFAALITFYPHPAAVLAPERAPLYLTTPGEQLALLEALNVDLVAMLPFNRQMAATSARQFMETASRHLRVRELWVGPDFTLGRNRQGSVLELRALGGSLGFEVHVVEPTALPGKKIISSSRIRALLGEGCVEEAAQMLGRYPSLSGEVVAGAHRGQNLGFPTANLQVRRERALPADGVYAVFALLGGARYPAVANVGVRPSFDSGERIVETYILDFAEDIYGCDLVVEFVARLRDELRFANIEDLVRQIGLDCQVARRILGQETQPAGSGVQATGGKVTLPACPYRYEEIEHTADRALRVWGEELPDLFVGAARGMYHLMVDLADLVPAHWRVIQLEALDRETLLVEWLNELLFLTETEHLLFTDFTITSWTGTSLTARAGGTLADISRTGIKAATFHDLELVQSEVGWCVVVTFDV